MNLNEIAKLAHENAVKKGFWDKSENIGEKLMLIVTEIAEAMEEYRKKDFNIDLFAEELADTVIRICDLSGKMNIDLDSQVQKKMLKNIDRPYLHGKNI
jgi:NTP pyrophosphatase (non-canonical NTP hydrolase)